MKNLLDDLANISKQKIILEPDVIITSKLLDFETILPEQPKINDELFEKIEASLISCLYANNAQISFQCSIRIAECLLQLYQGNRQMKIWNLITAFNKKPTDSIAFTTGHVLKKLGRYSKSVVPGVGKTLFSLSEKHTFAQLFALCACFKASPRDMDTYVDKCYILIKKNIFSNYEPITLLVLKLCAKLVKNGQLSAERIIPLLTQLLTDQKMPYIIDQSCLLIAKLAYSQFKFSPAPIEKDANENQDFKVKSKKVSAQMFCAFNMMENFKQYFSDILPKFLSLLDPEFIHANRQDIFSLIRRIDVNELRGLISMLGIDVRRDLFAQVAKEEISSEQITILLILSFDTNSLMETAALSYQFATLKSSGKDKCKIYSFFSEIVQKDPETTSIFLKKATKFLAKPPTDEENLEANMKGISYIISAVLTVAPNRKQLIELIEENLVEFLRNSWDSDSITAPSFQPSFIILTALPKRYIKNEEVDRLLSLFPRYLLQNQTANEVASISGVPLNDSTINTANMKAINKARKTALLMAETLMLFLSVRPNFESTIPIIECILAREYLRTHFNHLCIYLILPKLTTIDEDAMTKISLKLRSVVVKAKPLQDFVTYIVKSPFITRTMFLRNVEFKPPELKPFFTNANSIEIMYRVYTTFPDFIDSLPEKAKSAYVKWLVVDTATSPTSHFLIYTLINDIRTQKLLPSNIHEVILAVISNFERTDYLQMAAEVIACWARIFPKFVPQIIESAIQKNDRAECFILAALYAHVQLSDDAISSQVLILNNIAKTNNNLTPFALFALSSLFMAYPAQLAAMPYTDSQANFLLSLLCTSKSQDTFNLFYIARAFNSLLPIISPDIENQRPFVIPVVKMIIQLISCTPLPFCRQIFFHTMHTVFSFIKQYADTVKMEFPISKSITLSCKIEACQAFADMLNVKRMDHDFFELIPQCLLLLQRTGTEGDNNPKLFIIAVAANFATTSDPSSPNCRDRIMQWTQLIKLCVSAGNLPATGIVKIAANDTVKLCMLKVAQEILPLLLFTNPLLSEALDDVMTSLTRAVESKNPVLQEVAYPLLQRVILDFGEMKNENGQPIIELYDVMFASAVKIGFYNLDVSGDFVLSFLDFHIDNIENSFDEFLSILDYFITGFKECDHKTWHYHAIAAKLIKISIDKKSFYKKIEEFIPKFAKDFAGIIFEAGELWSQDPPNEIAITNFKVNYSSFFLELLESFVFMQAKKKLELIQPRQFLTFLFDELTNEDNEEIWRIKASFNALGAFLNYFQDLVTNKLLVKAINAVSLCFERISEMKQGNKAEDYHSIYDVMKPLLLKFMRPAAEMVVSKNKEAWKSLVSILADDNFDSIVLCYLIKNGGQEAISHFAVNFVELILDNFSQSKVLLEEAIALCTMIFYVAEDKLDNLVEFGIKIKTKIKTNTTKASTKSSKNSNKKSKSKKNKENDGNSEIENQEKLEIENREKQLTRFKFCYLSQIFKFFDISLTKNRKKFGEKISKLIWSNFSNNENKFGQNLAIQLLCETNSPRLAACFLLGDDCLDYSVSILDESARVINYFDFIRFLLENEICGLQNNDEFINSAIRFCLRVIIQWGDDKNGRNPIISAAQMLKFISVSAAPLIRVAFKEMGDDFQESAVKYLAQYAKKTTPNKRGANIQLFAPGKGRSRRKNGFGHNNNNDDDDDDDDWQDLTVDG
ncbi:hypothetical protein TRFO_31851 [Tritrichomonas foetus]|uniref:Uncharacterized protein n=1 Tax=Tritrichomonas foetus TaxID=1144522 RepID=A0A1J4JRD7_9EUKA|nr:hypothetical protein TRFO_31851 [Tritrichomonas foetus]|eukprot:OHT01314.1 hypothetical protein TRFO_31851 [Tritrichomonas foetus]